MNSLTCASKTYRSSNVQVFQLWWSKYSSAAATAKETIKIPNRIHRGPTDILKALEKTVAYDFTGPAYKYFDDPYLAPYNEKQARTYSLSKSAGHKAGTWFRDQHPELFTQVISDPPVMSYMPPLPINGDTANEEFLLQKINECKVTDAVKVYELMQEKKMSVSQETQLALLELLCFHNGEDEVSMENAAERYYGQRSRQADPAINYWKKDPLVDSLFSSLKHLGSAPYSALISGMYMHGAKAEGDELVKEAKEKNIQLDINAYNNIIKRTISVYDKVDVKWENLQKILKEMNAAGLQPNLGTLCNSIDVASRLVLPKRYSVLLRLLAEFKAAGVEPSVGVYGMIARSLVGRAKPDFNLAVFVPSILAYLKGKTLTARHPSDLLFFDWILKSCAVLDDLPSAINGLELFLHSTNRNLLDGYKTTSFFNNFFHVLGKKADFPTLIKYYNLLVPHVHTPSPLFYQTFFDSCDVNAEIKNFPTYWNHYMAAGAPNEETLIKMLEVAVNLTALPMPEVEEARKVLGELADNLFLFKMEQEKSRVFVTIPLTNEMCDFILHLLARGVRWRTTQTCLKYMFESDFMPSEKTVLDILENCYNHANPNMAVWVLKYCNKSFGKSQSSGKGLDLQPMASKIMKADFLNDDLKKDLRQEFEDSSSSSDSSTSDSESSDSDNDSSDSEDISVPRKPKPEVVKPDLSKLVKK